MKHNKHKKHSYGYTMVLFLAFIVAILLAGFSLYDNGTVAAERIRMQNTADATAYSTVNVLTRDMNFIAYTNRAMVANQVAIGQMVGISSWVHMIDQTAYNLDTVAKIAYLFPPVGVFLNKITSLIQKATSAGVKAVDKAMKVAIPVIDGVIVALSVAQIGFQLATADMAFATFNEVSKANDKDVTVGFVGSAFAAKAMIGSWKETVEEYNTATSKSGVDNKRHRQRFTEFSKVVGNSRDPFTKGRNHTWIKAGLPFPIFPLLAFDLSIDKKGGSGFNEVKLKGKKLQWQWTAMDTVSLWAHLKWKKMKWGKWKTKHSNTEILPVGWGAAHALNKKVKGNYYNYSKGKSPKWWGNGWANKISAGFAAGNDGANNLAGKKVPNGLQSFFDLKENDYQDIGPNVVAFLAKPRNKLKIQETLDENNAKYNRTNLMSIEEQGSIAGGNLYGLSKAETYFSRPRDLWLRADKKREYGNLYNPYWQTRLIENNVSEQTAATAAQVVF